MRFTSSLITLAAAFGVVHADSGCRVNMTSTLAAPANPGENILMKTMMKWRNSTESQMFSSDYCDWDNTMAAPFSVLFLEDTIPNFLTQEALEGVLDPWIGTWLISDSTTASAGVVGDYQITAVTCS